MSNKWRMSKAESSVFQNWFYFVPKHVLILQKKRQSESASMTREGMREKWSWGRGIRSGGWYVGRLSRRMSCQAAGIKHYFMGNQNTTPTQNCLLRIKAGQLGGILLVILLHALGKILQSKKARKKLMYQGEKWRFHLFPLPNKEREESTEWKGETERKVQEGNKSWRRREAEGRIWCYWDEYTASVKPWAADSTYMREIKSSLTESQDKNQEEC